MKRQIQRMYWFNRFSFEALVKELFKFQNTESKIQPNHGPSPMVVPRYS
jgi:hypothetical protein